MRVLRNKMLVLVLVLVMAAVAVASVSAQATPVFANIDAATTAVTGVVGDYPDYNMLGLTIAVIGSGLFVISRLFRLGRR